MQYFLFFPGFNRLDDQIFVNRNTGIPRLLLFHPYETYIAVADKDTVRSVNDNSGKQVLKLLVFIFFNFILFGGLQFSFRF